MENRCLIFLPTLEPAGYAAGHFGRVYDYVIVPACRLAGVWPERADNLNDSPVDVIKTIIESDVAICDVSANHVTGLYALAIRQALNLPVVFIKDGRTTFSFYGSESGEVMYDDSLRIDTVQKATEALGEALKNALTKLGEGNPVFNRLGIDLAKPKVVEATPVFEPIPLAESVAPKEKSLPVISPIPDYVGDVLTEDDIEKLKPGDFVFHINHGKGELKTARRMSGDKIAEVSFDTGTKVVMLVTNGVLRRVL